MTTNGRVLIIAGSDSSGGAGIQADIKTVTALGGYAMTAITAITAQNTTGVQGVLPISKDMVRQQITACLDDIGADIIKIGMVGQEELVPMLADILPHTIPVVLDPVLVATSGDALAGDGVVKQLSDLLIPRAFCVTPNVMELSALAQMTVTCADEQVEAGKLLLDRMSQGGALYLKGGHLTGEQATDILLSQEGQTAFTAPRLTTKNTHGTGCTLASALATGLAQTMPLEQAARRAHQFVHRAIVEAPDFGHGAGPLNHGHAIPPYSGD